jgi:energy-coupling factor transporter ATP-binding protein EcfA2
MPEYRVVSLEAENFKRLKAVRITPEGVGITRIVGPNGAGKTSVLDAIGAALGGSEQSPEAPIRKGESRAVVIVDLGEIVVTKRWGQGSTKLEVAPKDGGPNFPSPQALLDKLMGKLSFDPLGFVREKPAERAKILGKVAGLDLDKLEFEKRAVYETRTRNNRDLKTAEAKLGGMPPVHTGLPEQEVSVDSLLAKLEVQEKVNKKRAELEHSYQTWKRTQKTAEDDLARVEGELVALQEKLKAAEDTRRNCVDRLDSVKESVKEAEDKWRASPIVDTNLVKLEIADVATVNRKVRENQDRVKQRALVDELTAKSEELTKKLTEFSDLRVKAVAAANLPVPGLAIDDTGVTLNGVPFEQASAAEQLRTSVAIGLATNPRLKLMLVRDGSLLDANSLALLSDMAAAAGAQVFVERVANPGEVGVWIEDGEIVEGPSKDPA